MDVLDDNRGSFQNGQSSGKRNTRALINPNKAENWTDYVSTNVGLVAMARAYRDTYYQDPKPEESDK